MILQRRFRSAAVAAAVLLLAVAVAAPAGAEHFKPGSLRLKPNTTNTASTLVINGSFDQEPGAQLEAYNVDIARGFHFDPHAVAGRCTIEQAHSSSCPADSRIGSGRADVSVAGGRSTFLVDFYLTRPQQKGDISGLVLDVHQEGNANGFALVGRMVRLAHGPFGLELRFADTADELPAGFSVQLNKIHAHIGAQRKGHSLLTTPSKCTSKGWPFRLVVKYSTGTETYRGPARCSAK
jgi:hypothetical protein